MGLFTDPAAESVGISVIKSWEILFNADTMHAKSILDYVSMAYFVTVIVMIGGHMDPTAILAGVSGGTMKTRVSTATAVHAGGLAARVLTLTRGRTSISRLKISQSEARPGL